MKRTTAVLGLIAVTVQTQRTKALELLASEGELAGAG